MFTGHLRKGPTGFDVVDAAADPGSLIRLLDATSSVTGMTAAKDTLMERLELGAARAALDAGCGTGAALTEMVRLMPDGAQVSGIDASEAMIAEARRRTAGLGPGVSLRVGDAADLPYADQVFDACRVATVLQHVPDPARVISELARVTKPGGRVGALEIDQETAFLDHPDPQTTRVILSAFADAMVQGQAGRQLPRLFRAAGLIGVSVTPLVILSNPQFWRLLFGDHVSRLQEQGLLASERADEWWAGLEARAGAGDFLGGTVLFVVTGRRPG